MEATSLIYVAVGGALGSMLRYMATMWIGKINHTGFPVQTLIINISGAFLMGVWIGVMALMLPGRGKELHLLMAVGVLGGYATFSTFSLEAYLLLEKGLWYQAAFYMIGMTVLSVAAFFAGMWVLRLIHG